MARMRKVVVQGGGANLYEIYEYEGRYTASKVSVGFISDSRTTIGTARSLQDAIALIKAHSGKEIKSIG